MTSEIEKQILDIKQRCDRNTLYVSDAERHISEMRTEFMKEIKEIKDILRPIAKTYSGINLVGKWAGIFLGIAVTLSGLFWGWWEFFGKVLSRK